MSKYDEMRKELKYSIIDLDADHYNLSKFMQVIDEIFIKYRGNIEQPKIGSWIPCSEPPKHDKEVLIFNGKSYSVGYYDGKTWVNTIHPVEWQEIQHE